MLDVSLRELEYVIAVEQERNITRAATRLHVAQPALSQAIKRIERNVGVVLFERTSRNVSPTPAGALLADEARALVAATESALARVRRAGAPQGELKVHVTEPSLETPRRILREIRRRLPDAAIRQTTLPGSSIVDALGSGKLDLTIGARYQQAGCVSEVIRMEEVGILIDEDHPLATKSSITAGMVAEFPLVRIDDEMGGDWNRYVTKLFASIGTRPGWTASTVFGVLAGTDLLAGSGAVLLCLKSISQDAGAGFVWRSVEPAITAPWYLTWRAAPAAPPVDAALHAARAVARREGWRGHREGKIGCV